MESRKLPPVLEISGTLDPDEKSEVAAQFAGAVKLVKVDVGTRVKKGDVLVVLDASEAALRLAAAKSAADQQRARLGLNGRGFDAEAVPDVKAAKEARDLAVTEAKRAEELAKSGSVAQAVVDQAKSNAQRAEAAYEAARNGANQGFAALKTAEAQAGLSGKNLKDTKVVAPFDGAVQERRVSAGEFAGVGRVVAVVVKDNPLRLKIDVPESEIAGLEQDASVVLRVSAYPGRDFKANVKRIGAAINSYSRTLPVEAEVPNDEGTLRPGFFVRAQLALKGAPAEVLLVPESAVGSTGSNARVFVREGNRVIEKLVSTGRHVGDMVEIRGPLRAGDEVAAESVADLTDSREVAPR
ncbi:MAG: efflux RND transporter periplasmic adaptor subunit [Polyangiaceae bacterium]|nr:efflux RND transporter periplasmic adaptor subunit [Polyangiaceae bacterium]MCE7890869.1 efflux RND transporter periplasmic adaptor subunit [Sorangiineae bacterium PRO1]